MHSFMYPLTLVAGCLVVGCAASLPVPTQHLAEAEAAERSAAELGAAKHPTAQLHLTLAREQLTLANSAVKAGDNGRADALALRATSDAELAIALTRDASAKSGAQNAADQSNAQTITNANQGANK